MTRVHSSEDANARAHLRTLGYIIPPSRVSVAFQEGSYDCGRAVARDAAVPITCDPGAVPGTVVDMEAREVTIPYPEDALGREVDVRFVTVAVPLTIEPLPEDPLDVVEQQHPAHVPGEPMACGDEYSRLDAGPVRLDRVSPARELVFGTDIDVEVWDASLTWTRTTVELPDSARLWITQREQRRTALGNGDSFGYALHRVVGWADVTLPPSIELVRFDGPTAAAIGVGEVTWCDGPPTVSESALTLSVLAPHTVADESGSRTFQTLRID